MLSNEMNYLVSLEQHRDRLRGLERHQLVELARQQRPANREIYRFVRARYLFTGLQYYVDAS